MKGKIVAIPFPFTDLKGAKVRPALVIYEGHEDVIVAFTSSKIPAEPYNVHVPLTKEMPGFKLSGLKRDSVIQLNKLVQLGLNKPNFRQ
jgi:mRNA interferase MazF